MILSLFQAAIGGEGGGEDGGCDPLSPQLYPHQELVLMDAQQLADYRPLGIAIAKPLPRKNHDWRSLKPLGEISRFLYLRGNGVGMLLFPSGVKLAATAVGKSFSTPFTVIK